MGQRRWTQDDRRMEVWIYMADSIPYLSSPASSSPSGAALGAHTARSLYPGTENGAQYPPISQHRSVKWWPSGVEMKRPAHPVCAVSRRFRNCGHDCLGPRDFRNTVTAKVELQCMSVPPGALASQRPAQIMGCHASLSRAALPLRNHKVQTSEEQREKRC
jgi:hypothetical protein